MKTFPTAFATQKNLLTGAAPIWILQFTAGGVTYYPSDNAFSVPSATPPAGSNWPSGAVVNTLKWVKNWGDLQEGIGGTLDEFRISDFNLDLLSDPDASPNMETLATTYPLEASSVSLYFWFYGCTDAPQEMFRGYIKDILIPDETLVQLAIQDESLRLERAMIGTQVTLQVYPSADPDDVGKVIPIPFGSLKRLPALAVNAGIQTSLPSTITALATSFTVTSGIGLSDGMVIQVDDEQISIISISGDTITSCTRGVNSTVAALHQKGAMLWEQKTSFDYLASAIPVSSIPKVRAILGQTEIDITSICTRYTGQSGSVHTTYPGKAVVTIPGYVTASQAVNLLVADGISVNDAKSIVDGIGITDGIAVADTIAISEAAHNHQQTLIFTPNLATSTNADANNALDHRDDTYVALTSTGSGYQLFSIGPRTSPPPPGQMTRVRFTWKEIHTASFYIANLYPGNPVSIVSGAWYTPADLNWSTFCVGTDNYRGLAFTMPPQTAGNYLYIYDIVMEVEYDPTIQNAIAVVSRSGSASKTGSVTKTGTTTLGGTISKTGTVTLSGNSVANTLVGDQILCDVVALATSIPDVYTWLLFAAAYPGTFQQIGSWPTSYTYNGAITEYQSALYWLNELAFQSRAWFKLTRGKAQLIYRPDTLTPVKTLATCRISGGKRVHSRKKTIYDEILNTVSVLYNRDWAQTKGAGAYQAVATGSDATSIANYGPRERPELFQFDFVTDPAMAADDMAFYLWWYANRHWLHDFETYLYDAELEFGDAVTLGFAGNAIGQILETRDAPGSSTKSDTIDMVVVV